MAAAVPPQPPQPPLLFQLLFLAAPESRLYVRSLICASGLIRCLRILSSLTLNELANSIGDSGEDEIKNGGGRVRMLNASEQCTVTACRNR